MTANLAQAMTPSHIRASLALALATRATALRREAAQRDNYGPRNADHRANLREEAQRCEDLAHMVQATRPQRLADALGEALNADPETSPCQCRGPGQGCLREPRAAPPDAEPTVRAIEGLRDGARAVHNFPLASLCADALNGGSVALQRITAILAGQPDPGPGLP